MTEQLEERLKALEEEFKAGQRMLAELEAREATLRTNLWRISGAIQVLRELLPGAAPQQPREAPSESACEPVAPN